MDYTTLPDHTSTPTRIMLDWINEQERVARRAAVKLAADAGVCRFCHQYFSECELPFEFNNGHENACQKCLDKERAVSRQC